MRHRRPLALLLIAGLCLSLAGAASVPARAQDPAQPLPPGEQPYSSQEIKDAGHQFFGTVSREFALAVEQLFSRYGRPNAYILGEEGGGAVIGGLRYGEGMMYTRNAGTHKVFWQGPSLGFDIGADGARTMILVYNLNSVDEIYARFAGIAGAAFLVGGVGVTVLSRDQIMTTPIRAGVGARLGVNIGYLKFTRRATWNPF